MELLRNFLADPIWSGIQGIVALLMFVFYLWEKRDHWLPQMKKSEPVLRLLIMTAVFIASGWIVPLLFCLLPLSIMDSLSVEPLSLSALIFRLERNLSYLPRSLLLLATVPALAAMTTEDARLSEKRATIAGAVNVSLIAVYALFSGGLAEWYGEFIPGYSSMVSTVLSILMAVLSIAIFLSMGAIIGNLTSIGVHRLQRFLQSR